MTNNFTEKAYWDHFWTQLKLPCRIDKDFSNDRVISEFTSEYLPSGENKKNALEIGCAPGKWMIFLSEEMHYKTEGCEYLLSAAEKTRENLTMCGILDAEIHQGDFVTYDFGDKTFDIVIALGIIEHFVNPFPVISKMISLMKPDGYLILGVPKLTGLNYLICRQVDKNLDFPLIPAHNLSIMNLNFFIDLERNFQIRRIQSAYIGGFEPDLFDVSNSPFWFKTIFHGIRILLTTNLFKKLNLSCYAGYIMAVYKKEENISS